MPRLRTRHHAAPTDAPRQRRVVGALRRPPLRVRLVAGFAAAMLLVLAGAGIFVYFRVQYALDLRLDEDLQAQSAQLTDLVHAGTLPQAAGRDAVSAVGSFQVLDVGNHVIAGSRDLPAGSLLTAGELHAAVNRPVRTDRGQLLPISARPLRLYAVPLHAGAPPPSAQPAVALVAVRRNQRDEALRELIAQLTLANLAALAIASLVGYLERRFINDASHELRTPLTLLSTELELALRRPRTVEELENTVRSAAVDTANLIALADTLLSIGVRPIDSDAAPIIDFGGLVIAVSDRYHHTTGAMLHTITAADLAVHGDPTRLQQVITNLLDNALRHGGQPITVTAARAANLITLMVHDEGPGMDPQFLPRATERFSRADTARTSPGTGLGLSLVDAIVRAHHGELRICSTSAHHLTDTRSDIPCDHPPTGTTITVLIPAA